MLNSKPRRESVGVSAGSMADIAFLLLIFFLVTTTIEVDKGILAKLPRWSDEIISETLASRNVLTIKINAQNELLVENEQSKIEQLREKTIEFITNPTQNPKLAELPKKAIISLQNDRSTSYETYLIVYNELKGAYNDIRETAAQKQFGTSYENLKRLEKKQIIETFPMIISEAEPTEY